VLVVGSGGVFLQIASVLAGRADAWAAWCCAYGVLWLAGLAVWAKVVRTPRARMYAVAAMALVVIGGAMVAYLGREFGNPTREFDWAERGWLGPMIGGISVLEVGPSGKVWAFLGAFWICGGAGWWWARRGGRKVG
jgi:hypothetical protein